MTISEFNQYIEQTRGRMLRFSLTILRNRHDAETRVMTLGVKFRF